MARAAPALADKPFQDALEVARTATFSAYEWEAYERAKMAEQDARGALTVARREGREEGIFKEKRNSVLRLLAARNLVVSDAQRARIEACTAVATLDAWFDRAIAATTADEMFGAS